MSKKVCKCCQRELPIEQFEYFRLDADGNGQDEWRCHTCIHCIKEKVKQRHIEYYGKPEGYVAPKKTSRTSLKKLGLVVSEMESGMNGRRRSWKTNDQRRRQRAYFELYRPAAIKRRKLQAAIYKIQTLYGDKAIRKGSDYEQQQNSDGHHD